MSRLGKLGLKPVATAVAIAIGAPGFVLAQESQQQSVEEVTVTGSRIAAEPGMTSPTPVTAVSAQDLAIMSPGSVIDSLSQLPQFLGNIGQEQIVGGQNSGGANINLRGAGVNRTLVLLDGRRVVSSNRFGTVDVNMLPDELFKSVETVTGGASASYGTDAVAGVVNFRLDTDFEGFKSKLQGGQTTRDDGKNYKVGLAWGHKFGEKLHVTAAVARDEYSPIDSFNSLKDRPYFNQASRVTNPDPVNGPRELILPYVAPTNFTNGGIIVEPTIPQLNRIQFLPDGTHSVLPPGIGPATGGCLCLAQGSQTYGVDRDTDIYSGYKRKNAFVHLKYELNDNTNVFLEGLTGQTRNSDRRESVSLLSIWQARIYDDNPYLPADIVTTMHSLATPRNFFGFGMFGIDQAGTTLGDSRQITDNRTNTGTLGFDTRFGDSSWTLNGYYQYGKNRQDFITQNGIRTDRLPLALDVVNDANGKPVCRVSLPQFDPTGIFKDCAPVNLFGGIQNLSPQAVAWIRDDGKDARQWTDQEVAELVTTGDVWGGLGAGPVAAAFGVSYRKDTLTQYTMDPSDEFPALPDGTLLSSLGIAPASLRGIVPQGESGGVAGYTGIPGLRFVPSGFKGDSNSSSVLFSSLRTISGGYDVKEAFTEFHIPLLKDMFLAKSLELQTAGRWADYAGSGSIWAYKFGVSWALNDQLRLRGTRSRDVRAATLQERFDQTRGGVNVTDPLNNNNTVTTASFSGGNPEVAPEKADTTTFGVVYQPSFLEGFTTTLDWYKIDINDAIAQLTSQNVVDFCAKGIDPSQCQFVHRAGDAPTGLIERVDNLFINLANQKISGVDLEMNYRHNLTLLGGGPESVLVRFFGTYLHENSIQNKGGTRDERAGQVGPGLAGASALPKYKLTSNVNYRNGPFSVFLQGRWIDGGLLDRLRIESDVNLLDAAGKPLLTINDNHVASIFYTDLNLSWTAGEKDNLNVYFNMTNVFDRAPPLAPNVIGRAGTQEFNAAIHDVIGRRYVVGFTYQF